MGGGGFKDPQWLLREQELLAGTRRGDRTAFGELYRAFAGPLFSQVLLPRLGDRQAAQDALAEAFRTALERLDDFQEQGISLYFWLRRIAINKALDQHRSRERSGRTLCGYAGMVDVLLDQAPDGAELFEQAEGQERIKGAVAGALARLNPRYRQAIELRFFAERTRPECAAQLGVSLGTFDVLLLRALRSFRKAWEEQAATRPAEEAE
jgi:RNA polymerase sigma-70 factor (ECF subfamily)